MSQMGDAQQCLDAYIDGLAELASEELSPEEAAH